MMNLNLLVLIVAIACLASTTTAAAVPMVKPDAVRPRRVKGVKSTTGEERVLQVEKMEKKDPKHKDGMKEFHTQEYKEMKAMEKEAKDAAIIAAGGVLPPAPNQADGSPPDATGNASDEGSEPAQEGEVGQQEVAGGDVAAAETANSATAERQYHGMAFALLVGAAVFSWSM